MNRRCYNCQSSEGIEGKNESIGCKKDERLHSAEDCCENHVFIKSGLGDIDTNESIDKESREYQKLDLSRLSYSGKVISTEEALKDVVPVEWPEEVLSGKKKVTITKAELDTEHNCVRVCVEESEPLEKD